MFATLIATLDVMLRSPPLTLARHSSLRSLQLQNYILPCNSIPVNNNLLIEWDDDGTIQDDLWSLVYQKRFEGDSLRLGQNAAAREISRWAEKQVRFQTGKRRVQAKIHKRNAQTTYKCNHFVTPMLVTEG